MEKREITEEMEEGADERYLIATGKKYSLEIQHANVLSLLVTTNS